MDAGVIRGAAVALCLAMAVGPVAAQGTLTTQPNDAIRDNREGFVRAAGAAVLRGIDKVSGASEDLEIPPGGSDRFGRLDVSVSECRVPENNPSGDAFAWVEIRADDEVRFAGWMIASSPALSALDDPRYDVWLVRCVVL